MWRPNERPFALHRNGYAGMQRYGAFLWSGDVYTTWETLRTHVPIAINTGLSGIPFWGTDIGGFVPTAEYTGELHVRWFQFGAFCPLFRAHGRDWHLRLPWGWNTGELGPMELRGYADGAANPDPRELHNPHVEPICRKYLELRYRMLPYIYTAARQCCETGLPMIRAMWLHHPDDPLAICDWRSVPLGSRCPGRACGRERCDEPSPLPATRHLVRFLDRGACRGRPRLSIGKWTSRRFLFTFARARCCRSTRSGSTPASRTTRRRRSSSIRALMDRRSGTTTMEPRSSTSMAPSCGWR